VCSSDLVLSACAALPLLPVLVEGGGPKLLEYAVTAKRTYVEAGSISYLDGVLAIPAVIKAAASPAGFELAARQLAFLLPFAVLPLLAVAVARPRDGNRACIAITAAFVCAGLSGVYPRADSVHLAYATPLLVLGMWLGIRTVASAAVRRVAAYGGLVVLAAAAAAAVSQPLIAVTSDDRVPSTLPHFRGVLIPVAQDVKARRDAALLAAAGRAGAVFVLAPDAGFRYLLSGVHNRTPFDYPLVTAFGLRGREWMRRALAGGRFPVACVSRQSAPTRLWAADLEAVIRRTMRPDAEPSGCRLYRRPQRFRTSSWTPLIDHPASAGRRGDS